MDYIEITDKDVAESIVTEVKRATNMYCEAFSNDTGSVVVCDDTTVIARVTPLSFEIAVAPLVGPFAGELTWIPRTVRTFDDMKKAASALDTATSRALNAALNH